MITEPKTDSEKIEWLWNRLDEMNSQNESLKVDLDRVEGENIRLKKDLENIRQSAQQSNEEIVRLATQLNHAKEYAAKAVQEHIALKEG